MWFMGTNDQPGDYRHSGCAGCHVVYANDREPRHSLTYAQYGRDGQTATVDPTIAALTQGSARAHDEGHGAVRQPGEHATTISAPVARERPPAPPRLHPRDPDRAVHELPHAPAQHLPELLPRLHDVGLRVRRRPDVAGAGEPAASRKEAVPQQRIRRAGPRGARPQPRGRRAARPVGRPRLPAQRLRPVNPQAQAHPVRRLSRPWLELPRRSSSATARAICSTPRARSSRPTIPRTSAARARASSCRPAPIPGKAVHMMDIHAEKGMQCADCHFAQDSHGNGFIYGEVANAIEIGCKDCHGTADAYPTLLTSRPGRAAQGQQPRAAPQRGRPAPLRMDRRRRRPARADPALDRRSRSSNGRSAWSRTASIPASPHFNAKAARAKLMSRDRRRDRPLRVRPRRRADSELRPSRRARWPASPATSPGRPAAAAATCRSRPTGRPRSTITRARRRATSRPTIRRSRATTCSSSAGTRPPRATSSPRSARPRRWCCPRPTSTASGSTSSSRRSAASGFSSQAFAPHFPHTVRTTETKTCSDCHLSASERQQCDHGAAAAARAPTSSTSSASTPGSGSRAASRRCGSPNGTSRRR